MSLTIFSRPFTISTYDPPSTPIALAAQDTGQTGTKRTVNEQGYSPGAGGQAPRTRTSIVGASEVWGRLKNTQATPPVKKKILPWVAAVENVAEGWVPPEGMFGPYPSRPPTTYLPKESQHRNKHPFAYDTQRIQPLSALASEVNVETALAEDLARGRRPMSDILSRGVGKGRNRDSTPAETNGSPGMGTFGVEASQDPVSSSEALPPLPPKSPSRTPKSSRKLPPREDEDLTTPRAQTRPMAGTGPGIDQAQAGPNVKVHHEYPFDPVEAAGKEQAALAHIEALRQLTGASGGPVIQPMNTGTKGPRETYETTTSVPSFGHILHQDGMPVSRHISYQQEPLMPSHGPILLGEGAVARELAGLSGTGFFHVPYGPDVRLRIGAGVPGGPLGGWKSMLASPADITVNPVAQAGVPGTTGGEPLGVIAESPATEQPQRRDDKSAYVESITDEQEPTIRIAKSRGASKIHTNIQPVLTNLDPARPESVVHPDTSAQASVMPHAHHDLYEVSHSKTAAKAKAKKAKSKDTKSRTQKTASAVPPPQSTRVLSEVPTAQRRTGSHPEQAAAAAIPHISTHTAQAPRAASAAPTMLSSRTVQPPAHTLFSAPQPTQAEVESDLINRLGPVLGPMVAYEMKHAHVVHDGHQPVAESQAPAPGDRPSLSGPLPPRGTMTPHLPTAGTQSRIPSMETHATYVPSQASPQGTFRELDDEYAELMSPTTERSFETTQSNVKHIVSESKFHDETLCQLLDAASLNLIGPDAKRALQRAARARVIELRDMRANGKPGGADLPMPSLHKTPPKKDRKRGERRRSASRDSKSGRSILHAPRPPLTFGAEATAMPEMRSKRAVQPTTPPEWAQQLLSRMSDFEAQLAEQKIQIPQTQDRSIGHHQDASFEIPPTLLNDLIFDAEPSPAHGLPVLHGPHGQFGAHGLHAMLPFDPFPFPFPIAGSSTVSPPGGAYLKTISTDDRGDRQSKANGTVLEWGSEVELPGDSRASPAKSQTKSVRDAALTPVLPPTIHIQPPTENMEKSMGGPSASVAGTTRTGRTPAPATTRSVGAQTPPQSGVHGLSGSPPSVSLPAVQPLSTTKTGALPHTALPDPLERDLPPPPSESIRSNRPSTPPRSTPFGASVPLASKITPAHHGGDTPISFGEVRGANFPLGQSVQSQSVDGLQGTIVDPSVYTTGRTPAVQPVPLVPTVPMPANQAITRPPTVMNPFRLPVEPPKGHIHSDGLSGSYAPYKTAIQSFPSTPPRLVDTVAIVDPAASTKAQPQPWDCVQQRLYSWAVVWEDSTFSQALEDISLGKQAEEFALSIFVMMTFKRMLKKSLTETPLRPVDKLFVPPTLAETISQAIHSQQFRMAQQVLEELWYPFMFKDPPRVIVALTRHPQEPNVWFAHRFDLASGSLRTYRVGPRPAVHDGRQFHWWLAIKQAWPQYTSKKDIQDSEAQTHSIDFDPAAPEQNSLIAMNVARNLFLGFRPENTVNISKLRESVWGEVKRLREKKRSGRLMVDLDSPSMTTS